MITACSKIIYDLEIRKNYLQHFINLRKIKNKDIKIKVNNYRKISKINNKFERLKNLEIQKRNKNLNFKLKNVKKRINNDKTHLNLTFNLKQMKSRKINKDNYFILNKINSIKSFYNCDNYNKDYLKHLYYKKNISENARRLIKNKNKQNFSKEIRIKKKLKFKIKK